MGERGRGGRGACDPISRGCKHTHMLGRSRRGILGEIPLLARASVGPRGIDIGPRGSLSDKQVNKSGTAVLFLSTGASLTRDRAAVHRGRLGAFTGSRTCPREVVGRFDAVSAGRKRPMPLAPSRLRASLARRVLKTLLTHWSIEWTSKDNEGYHPLHLQQYMCTILPMRFSQLIRKSQ